MENSKNHLGQAVRPVAQRLSLRISKVTVDTDLNVAEVWLLKSGCRHAFDANRRRQDVMFQNKRGKGKGNQYIKDLQDRLSKLESLLQRSGVASPDEGTQRLLRSASAVKSHKAPLLSHDKNAPTISSEALSGNASMGPVEFETLGDYWHQVARRLDQYKMGAPVSPQETEAVLLKLTIEDVCAELPLFDIPWFFERLRSQYSAETCRCPSWWACLNALTALAISRRSTNRSLGELSGFVWAFFKNAYAVLPDILNQADDLLAVQSLLAMAIHMRTSGNSRTTALLLSNACRIIHTVGLHTRSRGNGKPFLERETRNRVFWIGFILETEISITCGIPSILEKDNMDIELPTEWPPDSCGLVALGGEQRSINVFRLRVELANVQSRVQEKLYSVKTLKRTGSQLLETIQELQRELLDWRLRVPLEVRPEFDRPLMSFMRDTPLLGLHFMYFNCVSMIYWTAMRGSSGKVAMENRDFASQYAAAARATILLLNCIPGSQISGLWQIHRPVLPCAVSATLVLFVGVLENPYNLNVQTDLGLLKSIVQWTVRLRDDEGCDLANLRTASSEMVRIAESAISSWQPTGDQLPGVAAHAHTELKSLMGNLPNQDTDISRRLSGMLGVIWEDGSEYGPFVPDFLRPHTYGFGISNGIFPHPVDGLGVARLG
ncbi:fungal-specific transcription factor domain-containing protein [Talaromyces proteolyticus]|uniref:Fungal-specific transcription factor domain-containing protein n=1 Tax=Talaromyces proteolyticus TaxID=1131652 RepID=A0AAD4PSG5_9EURO|nr:fungal-specific transcription factor domain-containing protein [Talaromyces proteolyticus]KAH8691251.1 fungal-specific transcription factor domain-containing protein [Talaromyces proteolyticus]